MPKLLSATELFFSQEIACKINGAVVDFVLMWDKRFDMKELQMKSFY